MTRQSSLAKYLSVIIFLILSFQAFGQEWTKGLIMPNEDGSFKSCCIYIPKSGLAAYNQPNGKQIAQIVPGAPDHNGEVYKAFVKKDEELTEFNYTNFYMVGYEVMAIIYTDKKDGFVRINNGYWLNIDELESKGLILMTWMDYLINKEDVLGWYANDPGLNLRTEPSNASDIIITLKGDLFEIKPTHKTKGIWCKVKVTQYREHPCVGEGDLVVGTFTGWIKLLSDEQAPNVWEYGKGC